MKILGSNLNYTKGVPNFFQATFGDAHAKPFQDHCQ